MQQQKEIEYLKSKLEWVRKRINIVLNTKRDKIENEELIKEINKI